MNSNFKQLCLDKILNWTINIADDYHNSTTFPLGKKNNNSLFEDTSQYYCTWRDSNCVIVEKETGLVYKLCTQHMFYAQDWEKFETLYDISKTNNMRMDVPIHRESITQFNPHSNRIEEWEYTIVRRPNGELGRFFIEDLMMGNIDTDYLIEFIDDSYLLLDNIGEVNKIFKSGVTSNVSIFRRIHDSKGPFWIDFKRWKYSYEQQYERFMKMLSLNIDTIQANNLTSVNKELVIDYGTTKLSTLFK